MTNATTAVGQGFHTWSPEQHRIWAEQFRERHGVFPMAGGETAPAPAAPAQPGAPGQGEGDPGSTAEPAKSGDGFNWGLFPDVPEEQRPILEPHLKNVQGHVTKLEQQIAGFKDTSPEQVQSLVAFEQSFNQDPVGTWLRMAQRMQENELLGELDFEALEAIAKGEEPAGAEMTEGAPGDESDLARQVKDLQKRLEASEQRAAQQQADQEKRVSDRLLQQTIDGITTQLSEAGMKEVPEPLIVSAIMANGGDANKAVEQLTGLGQGALKGLADRKGGNEDELEMPKGTPKTPEKGPKGDSFKEATAGARAYLEKANAAAAQG